MIHRELTTEEKWVTEFESLVDYICEGYEETIYEYTNDLTCRLFIQKALEQSNEKILHMKKRINKADKKLSSILIKTKKCIHGDFPKDYYWFWGIPKNSTELTNEARLQNWL